MDKEKKELRRLYRERGRALTGDYREAADRAICAAVLASEAWQRAESVFLFVSMWAEPDTGPLFAAACWQLRSGCHLCWASAEAAWNKQKLRIFPLRRKCRFWRSAQSSLPALTVEMS